MAQTGIKVTLPNGESKMFDMEEDVLHQLVNAPGVHEALREGEASKKTPEERLELIKPALEKLGISIEM